MLFRRNKKSKNDEGFKFLTNVPDDVAATILEGLLRSHDILVKAKVADDMEWLRLYVGSAVTNIDIYVREDDYIKAKDILDNQISIDENSEIEGIPEE